MDQLTHYRPSNLVTVVVGTSSFLRPMAPCLRHVHAALRHARVDSTVVVVTDKKSKKHVEQMLANTGLIGEVLGLDVTESGELYKHERQLLIARLQSEGFQAARRLGCDMLWSVESDVLVPYNALSCSLQMLQFDDGYYDVAMVTYPSQGGGSFLGGYGSYQHPIAEDYLPEERDIPERLKKAFDACKERLRGGHSDKEIKRLQRLSERIKSYPPKGNVFELNAKGWRRRGWLNNSHPGIGKGAVIETDWTGLGCTLMSRKAADLAHFEGYDGGGTQDLFLNWHRWKPAGLRFCCITHTTCSHIVRDAKAPNGFTLLKAYHEHEGEMQGHLRYERRPFCEF